MFKVICINGVKEGLEAYTIGGKLDPVRKDEEVYEGHVYTVIEVYNAKATYYCLEEKAWESLYNADRFVPCSDIDEQQLTETDRLLQACADMMPEVEMEPGTFERVWQNVQSSLWK